MQQIELYSRLPEMIDAIERLGRLWARSGCFKCSREEQGPTILSFCIAMGITPMEFIATYDLIDGVPRKKALACLADFRKRGGRHKWLCQAEDREKAVGEFTIEGQTYKVTGTIEDAKLQGLVKPNSNWVKTPSNMLRARVITTAIGMLAPEIVAGTDADDDSLVPTSSGLNLTSLPSAATSTTTNTAAALAALEEQTEADMGLAPAKPAKKIDFAAAAAALAAAGPPAVPAKPKTVAPPKKLHLPAALDPVEDDEQPMPPATEIGPEAPSDEPKPAPAEKPAATPVPPEADLDPVVVETMGRIFEGHFLEVANWMIKQAWIAPSAKPLNTETQAAVHLQRMLPGLAKSRAKKVLAQKMAFMRAVEDINP